MEHPWQAVQHEPPDIHQCIVVANILQLLNEGKQGQHPHYAKYCEQHGECNCFPHVDIQLLHGVAAGRNLSRMRVNSIPS